MNAPVPRFPLGRVVATPGALAAMQEAGVAPADLLRRHVSGDWGDVPAEDAAENELSVREGFRILSSYTLPGTDARIWLVPSGIEPSRPSGFRRNIEMPARFRISYEDRDEDPLEGRETFFDDEAEARAWYRDDIANPDPEVGAVGLWAIGDTDDHLLDCHTFPVEYLYSRCSTTAGTILWPR